MRTILFAFASAALVACAASPADQHTGGTGGGGGKGDDATETGGCPIMESDADKIIAAIEGGGSCYTASGIAESCAWGSSIDVQFVSAATDVCSTGFASMPAAMKAKYDALTERCFAKYADQEGTLYRSAASFCALEVTQLFVTFYPEANPTEATVAYSAAECSANASDPEAIEKAIREAGYCGGAADTAAACAWGSSIDVQFVAAAEESCTVESMTAADKTLSDDLKAACDTALADEGGTLGRSMLSFCYLHVDQVMHSLYEPVE